MVYRIQNIEQFTDLWTTIYNTKGRPDWSHILPYYDDSIHFRDCIQEIHGMEEFKKMTERLTNRSQDLQMKIVNIVMEDKLLFFEWEMTLNFRQTRTSTIYGLSRLTLNDEGRIVEQRDYYDLWGDVFDNIPGVSKGYRMFMKKLFG
ncbi:MAG: nuclear transport factor 2 family protein [Candidatus Thorarchaeota archaeon]|nr:MAG: nuclear transport factor 2 family protein [Candidatus Thorarchaeota archaeon]